MGRALCVVTGIVPGRALPRMFQSIGRIEVAQRNLPVGVPIEVPVMLFVVGIVNRSRRRHERRLTGSQAWRRPASATRCARPRGFEPPGLQWRLVFQEPPRPIHEP